MPARTSAGPREAAKRFEFLDVMAFLLLVLNSVTWFRRCDDQRCYLLRQDLNVISAESNPVGLGK
jgi:hypothetical protein